MQIIAQGTIRPWVSNYTNFQCTKNNEINRCTALSSSSSFLPASPGASRRAGTARSQWLVLVSNQLSHTWMKIAQCPLLLSQVSFSNLHASFSPASASAKLTERRGAQCWTKGDSNCPENFSQRQIFAWPECKEGYGKNIYSTQEARRPGTQQCPTVYCCHDLENCLLRGANEVTSRSWAKSFFSIFLLLSIDFLPITFHLPKETVRTSRFEGIYHTEGLQPKQKMKNEVFLFIFIFKEINLIPTNL